METSWYYKPLTPLVNVCVRSEDAVLMLNSLVQKHLLSTPTVYFDEILPGAVGALCHMANGTCLIAF